MAEKFNPEALAERYEEAGAPLTEVREGVQTVDEVMIRLHLINTNALHPDAVRAFSDWANVNWFEHVSDEADWTNDHVLESLLREWCGGRVMPKS